VMTWYLAMMLMTVKQNDLYHIAASGWIGTVGTVQYRPINQYNTGPGLVISQAIKKCLPVKLYWTEACPMSNAQIKSLNLAVIS